MRPQPANPRAARLSESEQFYALTDLNIAKRMGGLACGLGLLIVLGLLPFFPPTHHVGDSGWLLGGACIAAAVAVGVRLLRWSERVTPNELMLLGYLSLAIIMALEWLGGRSSPYAELYFIGAVGAAAVHPPRRVLPYLVALGLAAAAPLVYDDSNTTETLRLLAHLLLWAGVSALIMRFVHLNRQGVRREGEVLRELAHADPLTRLGNRRAFDDALHRAVSGARRWDRPFSILVADLTGFKGINDRFGHLEGDRCLREVGDALLSTVRAPDSCFRWGGDEFAIVLPASDLTTAALVGDRLSRTIEQRVILPNRESLRLSWAAAQFEEGMDAESLLATADDRLMSMKSSADRRAGG
ncbi:MAG: GGDEF domain-containing protein [Actinomycetota bacterium]|nr:GGDEF domain-containing protein [Actinomycetota bacterium]